MRVVRRASLIFSLTLIVAIAVGYVARHAEMAGQRDQALATAAEVGATRMSAIIAAVEIAGRAGQDLDETTQALASVHPDLGVCAVAGADTSCTGDGPRPTDVMLEDRRTARESLEGAAGTPTISAYESVVMIVVDGPNLSLVAQVPVDAIAHRGHISVTATTLLPRASSVDEFVVQGGIRQTATPVESAPDVYVVAS